MAQAPSTQTHQLRDPDLATLFSKLEAKLDTNTMRTLSTQRRVEKVEADFHRQKTLYFRQRLILDELKAVMNESASGLLSESQLDSEVCDSLATALTAAESQNYLHPPSLPADVTLLGLTEDSIPSQPLSETDERQLTHLIRARLVKKLQKLTNFHSAANISSGRLDGASAVEQLSRKVREEYELQQQTQKATEKLREERQEHLHSLGKTLISGLERAQSILVDHKLGQQQEFDKAKVERLLAQADALCLKLKHIDKQVLAETYSKDNVAALKNVRRYLETEISSREKELHQSSHTLRSYESVSLDFDSLVTEYENLCRDMENKRWALQQLQTTRANSSNQ